MEILNLKDNINSGDIYSEDNNRLSFIKKFLIVCSGARVEILREFPADRSNYMSIGACVLFTGLFAFISSSYAFYKIFNTNIINDTFNLTFGLSLSFGLLWGIMIFNLDRFIVSSMIHYGTNKWRQFFIAIPRFIIAGVISIVIATPLEVKVMEKRINGQIFENRQLKYKDYVQDIFLVREKLNLEIDSLKGTRISFLERRAKDTDEIKAFVGQYNEQGKRLLEMTRALEPRRGKLVADLYSLRNQIADLKNHILSLDAQVNSQNIILSNLLSSDLEKQNAKNEKEKISIDIQFNNNRIDLLNQQIKSKRNELAEIDKNLDAQRMIYNNLFNKIEFLRTDNRNNIDRTAKDLEAITNEKHQKLWIADSIYNIQTVKSDSVLNENYIDDFVNQVESLSTLTRERFSTMWWIYFLLTIVFFLIATIPVIVKLLAPPGSYEAILDKEREKEIVVAGNKVEKDITISKAHIDKEKDEEISLYQEFFKTTSSTRRTKMNDLVDKWKNNRYPFVDLLNQFQIELTELGHSSARERTKRSFFDRMSEKIEKIKAVYPNIYIKVAFISILITMICAYITSNALAVAIGEFSYLLLEGVLIKRLLKQAS